MNEPRQKQFSSIGATGCFFLSIVHLAENFLGEYVDAYTTYLDAIQRGLIGEDCFVNDAAALLGRLTTKTWTCEKLPVSYTLQANELLVTRYEWKDTMTTHIHFVVCDAAGVVTHDPYGASLTVKNGAPAMNYVFRRTA